MDRNYKREDKNRSSSTLGIRIDRDLAEQFKEKAEKLGRSRNSIIVEWIEDFVFKDRD